MKCVCVRALVGVPGIDVRKQSSLGARADRAGMCTRIYESWQSVFENYENTTNVESTARAYFLRLGFGGH